MGVLPYEIAKARIETSLVLPDTAVFEAGRRLWDATRMVVEPGAATALAALTSGAYVPAPKERVAVLLCGGNAAPDWFLAE